MLFRAQANCVAPERCKHGVGDCVFLMAEKGSLRRGMPMEKGKRSVDVTEHSKAMG